METSASPQPPRPVPRALGWHPGRFSRWKRPSSGHQVHLAGLPLLANPKTCRMQDAQGEKNLIASRYPALQSCQEIWLWIQQHLEEILPCTSASKSNYLKMAAPSSRSRLPHPHHPGKAGFRPLRTRANKGVPRTPQVRYLQLHAAPLASAIAPRFSVPPRMRCAKPKSRRDSEPATTYPCWQLLGWVFPTNSVIWLLREAAGTEPRAAAGWGIWGANLQRQVSEQNG